MPFPRRSILAPILAAALLLAAGSAEAAPAPTGVTDTIAIQLVEGKLRFVAPLAVTRGDELRIVNRTNPRLVGPHTFSLVRRGAIPRSRRARRNCGEPGHLCASIAAWHGYGESEEVTANPAEAGAPGWSTMGNARRAGDSWFTEARGESVTQPVTAAPGFLYFVCAIHPWMHGRVRVVEPPAEEAPVGEGPVAETPVAEAPARRR